MNICLFIKSKNSPIVYYVEKYHANVSLQQQYKRQKVTKPLGYPLQNKVLREIPYIPKSFHYSNKLTPQYYTS